MKQHSALKLKTKASVPSLDVASPQNPYILKRPVNTSLSLYKNTFPIIGNKSVLSPLTGLPEQKAQSTYSTARVDTTNHSTVNIPTGNVIQKTRFINSDTSCDNFEELFDNFLVKTVGSSFENCIEKFFLEEFNAKTVTYWNDIPSLHVLYNRKLKLALSHSDGLVGFTFFKREIIVLTEPSSHPAYKEKFDRCPEDLKLTMMLFPLWDNLGNVCAVVQMTRPLNEPFEVKREMDLIKYFTKKIGITYPLLFHPPRPEGALLELMRIMEIEQFLLILQKQMESLFSCRCAEIWKLDRATNELFQYKKTKKKMDSGKAGIVGEALQRGYPVNVMENRMLSSYCEETDGTEIEPVLVIPVSYLKRKLMYAICIRGGTNIPVFTKTDEEVLKMVAPWAFLAVDNLDAFEYGSSTSEADSSEKQCIEGLTDMIECITSKATIGESIQTAVEKMGLIAHADKSTWYIIDKKSMSLKTLFCTNKGLPKETVSNRTIPARVFANHEVFNIADAYDDFEFDSSVDLETGYRTTSLLEIPVMNYNSDIVGVLEFSNRLDNQPFPNSIVKYIRILSTFVSLMVDNEKLQQDVLSSSQDIRKNLSLSMQLTSDNCLQSTFKNIIRNVRRQTYSESGAIYLLDEEKNRLMRFVDDGVKLQMTLPMTYGMAALSFKTKDAIIANDVQNDTRYVKDPLDLTGIVIKTLLVVPIISFNGKVIGVIEVANKDGYFTGDEVRKVRSLAVLVAVSFEEKSLSEIGAHGNVIFETNRWIDEFEKQEQKIPEKLKLLTKQLIEVDSIYFDSLFWDESDNLYKVIFYIFDSLSLTSVFKIPVELLFCFIYDVRGTYSDYKYHGWPRAIDCLQLVSFQIKTAKLTSRLTNVEILCLCIAALCHNCGYDDEEHNNSMNIASQILHQDKSDVSAKRCAMIINILSKRECNILRHLNEGDLKTAWNLIIRIISGLDPAFHFTLLDNCKKLQAYIDGNDNEKEGSVSKRRDEIWTDQNKKLTFFTLMVKCGTLAQMCRPDDIYDKWQMAGREEMRVDKQYDREDDFLVSIKELEKEKLLRRMKDEIAFADLIAMPMMKVIGGILPNLKLMYQSGEVNLERCKEYFFSLPDASAD